MNTRNAHYGSYSQLKGGKWVIHFWNPLLQKKIHIGVRDTEEEAKELLKEVNFDFYSKNSWLLPKAISINNARKNYSFAFQRKEKTIIYGQYNTLEEAVAAKLELIGKLI